MTLQTSEMTPAMRAYERLLGRPLRKVLLEDYAERSLEEIAAEFEISEATLRRWMQRLGIGRAARSVLVDLHDPQAASETDGSAAQDQEVPANANAPAAVVSGVASAGRREGALTEE